MTTTTRPATRYCNECGQPGARLMAINFGDDDRITSYLCGTACRDVILARHAEWLTTVEGKCATAARAGLVPCGHCGTTEDVHECQDNRDGTTGYLCIACGAKADPEGTWLRVIRWDVYAA